MNSAEPKLIIIRGPSGSGKTTTARKLREGSNRKAALLDFDTYRNDILGLQGDYYQPAIEMYTHSALTALANGYDVVMDGIYRPNGYDSPLEKLISGHDGENYIFYFDVSLDETIKRHAGREKSKLFGEKELTEWYSKPTAMGYDFEYAIPEHSTIEQTLELIRSKTGL